MDVQHAYETRMKARLQYGKLVWISCGCPTGKELTVEGSKVMAVLARDFDLYVQSTHLPRPAIIKPSCQKQASMGSHCLTMVGFCACDVKLTTSLLSHVDLLNNSGQPQRNC